MIQPSTFSLPLMPGECCWMPRSGLSRASSRRTQWNLNVQHERFVTPVPIPAKENLRPTPHPALSRRERVLDLFDGTGGDAAKRRIPERATRRA